MSIPADSHVHTAWSWDAPHGSMRASCERAIEIGLPGIAFTEHVDHTVWRVSIDALDPDNHLARLARDGHLHPPRFDAAAYLHEVEECHDRYPELRILSGLELGEPHRHREAVAEVLASGTFDRVLGSLHSLADGAGYAEPTGLLGHRDPAEILRTYLAEVALLAGSDQTFEVLAHIDYPVVRGPRRRAVRAVRLRGRVPPRPARHGGLRTGPRGEHQGPLALGDPAVVARRRRSGHHIR